MKLRKRKIKYTAIFCLCWFAFLVILVDGVLKFQTLVDYFGSYALVEITLLLLVILPTIAVYRLTKEDKTMSKRDYIQANKDWLEAKSKEEEVKALPKGIYYKVLAEGDATSAQPTVRSIITAHYTGKTIDGKQFDSSRGGVPLACRLCDLIEGWIIAMQQMHIGAIRSRRKSDILKCGLPSRAGGRWLKGGNFARVIRESPLSPINERGGRR